jgi:hypothetical protein
MKMIAINVECSRIDPESILLGDFPVEGNISGHRVHAAKSECIRILTDRGRIELDVSGRGI